MATDATDLIQRLETVASWHGAGRKRVVLTIIDDFKELLGVKPEAPADPPVQPPSDQDTSPPVEPPDELPPATQ